MTRIAQAAQSILNGETECSLQRHAEEGCPEICEDREAVVLPLLACARVRRDDHHVGLRGPEAEVEPKGGYPCVVKQCQSSPTPFIPAFERKFDGFVADADNEENRCIR